jgi:DNA-binding LacI/PurR family transcriptional regulator
VFVWLEGSIMAKPLTATRHFQVMRTLRQELSLKEPGAFVPTVNELKQRFNASQATIAQALSTLQEEGLIRRPDGRNRLVVSDMPPKAAQRVVLVRPSWSSPDYDALQRSMVTDCNRRGWQLEVDASHSEMHELELNRAIGNRDAGVLMTSMVNIPDHLMNVLRKPNRPVVTVIQVPDDPEVSGVGTDNIAIGRMAIEYLMSQGHEQILTVISEPRAQSIVQRAQGARDEMLIQGQTHADDLILDCRIRHGEDSIAMTYESFCEFLINPKRPKFTAVFCVAWTGALAVMKALKDVGNWRVPDDVSLVTYAGESLLIPYLNPPLTAIETNVDDYARNVLDLIEGQLDDPTMPAQKIALPCQIVERESVMPSRQSNHPNGI